MMFMISLVLIDFPWSIAMFQDGLRLCQEAICQHALENLVRLVTDGKPKAQAHRWLHSIQSSAAIRRVGVSLRLMTPTLVGQVEAAGAIHNLVWS